MSKLSILLILVLSTNLLAEDACNENRPFKRAIVFPGGSLQMVVYLGMLKAAEEVGKEPDVIVADCGGSLAAAIAHTVSDTEGRIELLKSKEMHKMLLGINPNDTSTGNVLKYVLTKSKAKKNKTIAPILSSYFLDVPRNMGISSFDAEFNVDQIPVVISAGKVLYNLADEGKESESKKLYQEVIFTDKNTAEKIINLPSAFKHINMSDKVEDKIEINSHFKINDAVRAAISEPLMMSPIKINGINYNVRPQTLQPLEMAKQLACEVIMPFRYPISSMESSMIQSVFGVAYNERLTKAHSEYADYWVDISDQAKIDESAALGPVLKLTQGKMMLTIPKDYQEYRKRMQLLYNYGYERGMEVLGGNIKNEKAHIRLPVDGNSSMELQKKILGQKKAANEVFNLIVKAQDQFQNQNKIAETSIQKLKNLADAQNSLNESAVLIANLYTIIKKVGENSSFLMQKNTRNYLQLVNAWVLKNSEIQDQLIQFFEKSPEMRKHKECWTFDTRCLFNDKIDHLRGTDSSLKKIESVDSNVLIWKSMNEWSKDLNENQITLKKLSSIFEHKSRWARWFEN